MRWTKNDTLAFDATTKAGEGLRKMYEQSQAAQAYKDGGQEQRQDTYTDASEADRAAAAASAQRQGQADAAEFGLTPQEQTTYAPQAGTRTASTQYGLGANPATWQNKPFTESQRHVGGLRAQMADMSARGDVEGAGKLMERVQASESHDLQNEASRLSIDSMQDQKRRRDILSAADEQFKKDVANPAKYLERGFNADVMGNMPGVKVETTKTATGYKARLIGPDGQPVPGQSIRHLTNEEVHDLAFTEHMKATGNVTGLAAFEQHRTERAQDVARHDRQDTLAETSQKDTKAFHEGSLKNQAAGIGVQQQQLRLANILAGKTVEVPVEYMEGGVVKTARIGQKLNTTTGMMELVDPSTDKVLSKDDPRLKAYNGTTSASTKEERIALSKAKMDIVARDGEVRVPKWYQSVIPNTDYDKQQREFRMADNTTLRNSPENVTNNLLAEAMAASERASKTGKLSSVKDKPANLGDARVTSDAAGPAPAEYGMLKAGRVAYLEGLADKSKATPSELQELMDLRASRHQQQRSLRDSADTFSAGVSY